MVTASLLVHNFSDGALLYIPFGYDKGRFRFLLLGIGKVGWLVIWLTDTEKLIVYQPVRYPIASGVRIITAPRRRMSDEVSLSQVCLRFEINDLEV